MSYSENINSLLERGELPSAELLEELKQEEISKKSKRINEDDKHNKIKIIYNYDKPAKKRVINDFVKFFNHRFKYLEKIIRQRPEMQNTTSINKLKLKGEKEAASIIGIISDKSETKNKHILLKLEDVSGNTNVLISKNNKELLTIAHDLVLDEVIGISGSCGGNILFANNIIFPDVPLNREVKKAPKEEYAVFISDLHIGSKVFLKEEFEKFISWLNGLTGSKEQKEIASKTKYLFLTGDLVEGVGVYPGQEEDLEIKDIKKQYELLVKYLIKINPDIKIIMCPGNHDAGRLAEPQPAMYNDFAQSLLELPNGMIVSNPSIVNIGGTEKFSGLDILMYHGYSLIYYADKVPSIRAAGGQKRVDLIMKLLLQKRHLAPTHNSNMYVPDADEDPLLIKVIPDVFVTGHIHRATAAQYRGITLLNTSCWGDITEDQEKRGLEPQPGRAITLNLQTRKVKIVNFYNR